MSQSVPDPDREADIAADASPRSPAGAPRTFSLATLMTGMLLLALCFGVMFYAVGLGIAVLILMVLAVLRIKFHRYTAWSAGWRLRWGPALALLVLLPIVCIPTFFATCFATAIGLGDAAARWGIGRVQIGFPSRYFDTMLMAAICLGGLSAMMAAELLVALFLRKSSS
jgi:hypothetical protein